MIRAATASSGRVPALAGRDDLHGLVRQRPLKRQSLVSGCPQTPLGQPVYVPIHSEYREILARTHVEHPALHLREDSEPWTLAGYRTAWQREISCRTSKGGLSAVSPEKAAGMARLKEAGFVFHGLRKNAVNMLLEAGCTEAEVSAIVEMSEQMVRYYSRDVDKRRLARSAMRKLEDGWAETRKNLFGSSSRTHGNA